MHSLTVVFGPAGGMNQFLFKERSEAEKAVKSARDTSDEFVVIKDDFNGYGEIKKASIHSLTIEDLTSESMIERSLANAKAQIKLQNRAANDPAIKFAASNGGFALNHPGPPQGHMRRQA